jgi:hypothetical protein
MVLIVMLCFSAIACSGESKQILLVIDMQTNLLMPGKGGLHVDSQQTASLIMNVNRAIQTAESRGIPVCYVLNEWTNPIMNFFTNNVCKKGARGTGVGREDREGGFPVFYKIRAELFQQCAVVGVCRTEFHQNRLYRRYHGGSMRRGHGGGGAEKKVGGPVDRSRYRFVVPFKIG